MSVKRRVWVRLVIGAGVAVFACWMLLVWHKSDTCRRWSEYYAAEAKRYRSEAANPSLGQEAAAECLASVEVEDLLSRKWAEMAKKPWRAYPEAVATEEELREIARKHKGK